MCVRWTGTCQYVDREMGKKINKVICGWTDRQTEKQTDRQTLKMVDCLSCKSYLLHRCDTTFRPEKVGLLKVQGPLFLA